MLQAFLILLVAIGFTATGELLLKHGMNQVGFFSLRPDLFFPTLLRIAVTPSIIIGLVSVGIASVLWLSVLSRVPLSWAYPMLSMSYIIGMFGSAVFLGETLTVSRLVGVAVIIGGVVIMYRS